MSFLTSFRVTPTQFFDFMIRTHQISRNTYLYEDDWFPERSTERSTELTPKSQAEVLSKGTNGATPVAFDRLRQLFGNLS